LLPIKKNLVSIIAIILLLLGLVGALLFLKSTFNNRKKTREKIDAQIIRIKNFKKFKDGPLSRKGVEKWYKRYESLQDNFQQIIEVFDGSATKMPVDIKGPLEFKEELFNQQIKLIAGAEKLGFKLPSNLGFEFLRSIIPKEEEIPLLTKKMEILQGLVKLMIESRISNLSSITFSDPVDKRLEGSQRPVFYRDFGLNLSVVGETENIVKFLHLLEIDDFIFVVNDFAVTNIPIPVVVGTYETAEGIKNFEKKMIQAELDISTCIYFFDVPKEGEKSES